MDALAARHDAAVQMIDTSVVRVHLPRLKIRNTFTVQAPTPGILVRSSTTSSSGSPGSATANLRCPTNHLARALIVRDFAFESPAAVMDRRRSTMIFFGVSGPFTVSCKREKIEPATVPETL